MCGIPPSGIAASDIASSDWHICYCVCVLACHSSNASGCAVADGLAAHNKCHADADFRWGALLGDRECRCVHSRSWTGSGLPAGAGYVDVTRFKHFRGEATIGGS